MPRRNNHNDEPVRSPTWEDVRRTMQEIAVQHHCFVFLKCGIEQTGGYGGCLFLEAQAVDWNDGVGGKPCELYRLHDPLNRYKTMTTTAYMALHRLDAQLEERWGGPPA